MRICPFVIFSSGRYLQVSLHPSAAQSENQKLCRHNIQRGKTRELSHTGDPDSNPIQGYNSALQIRWMGGCVAAVYQKLAHPCFCAFRAGTTGLPYSEPYWLAGGCASRLSVVFPDSVGKHALFGAVPFATAPSPLRPSPASSFLSLPQGQSACRSCFGGASVDPHWAGCFCPTCIRIWNIPTHPPTHPPTHAYVS